MSPLKWHISTPDNLAILTTDRLQWGTISTVLSFSAQSLFHFSKHINEFSFPSEYYRPAVLNRRPLGRIRPASLLFMALELLFLHYVFWLGRHVYTGSCLHASNTQTAGSLTAASSTFNFHFPFQSSSRINILQTVRDWKWHVPSKPLQKGTMKICNSKKGRHSISIHSPFNQEQDPFTRQCSFNTDMSN